MALLSYYKNQGNAVQNFTISVRSKGYAKQAWLFTIKVSADFS